MKIKTLVVHWGQKSWKVEANQFVQKCRGRENANLRLK